MTDRWPLDSHAAPDPAESDSEMIHDADEAVRASVRLSAIRERTIREAVTGADPFGSQTPAWMVMCLLDEVDRLRARLPDGSA